MVDVNEIVGERGSICRAEARAPGLFQQLHRPARYLDGDPPVIDDDAPHGREECHRLGNVLEYVGKSDRVELLAELRQPLGAQSMDRSARAGGGVRGGALVDLGSFGAPTSLDRELHEPAGVAADVEQRARRRPDVLAELGENAAEDQIPVVGIKLFRDPLWRPALVVHPLEETR